jgi:hypothetical protein
MRNKKLDNLLRYVMDETIRRDKLQEDVDQQLVKIHQFNGEVRTALNKALDRITKLEKEVYEWEQVDGDEGETCACEFDYLEERINALADYLKVDFKEEGLKATKK